MEGENVCQEERTAWAQGGMEVGKNKGVTVTGP